jgi:hypothetical protein
MSSPCNMVDEATVRPKSIGGKRCPDNLISFCISFAKEFNNYYYLDHLWLHSITDSANGCMKGN